MSHTRSVSIWLVVALALSLVAGSFGVSQVAANGAAPLSLSLPSAYVVASLPSGASGVAAEINGHTLFWNNVGGKILLSLDQPSQADGGNAVAAWPNFCRYAVTSALFALGAVGLGAAAASGGLVVAGIFLAPAFLTQAAVVATSFSAVYALVGAFVC